MRVLVWALGDPNFPGGAAVQRKETAASLREIGVDVVESCDPQVSLAGFDVVHAFCVGPPQLRRCRQRGIRVCLSTVWLPTRDLLRPRTARQWYREGRARLKTTLKLVRGALRGEHHDLCVAEAEGMRHARAVMELADLLLPNSVSEAETIRRELDVTTPCHVVPNAVDPARFVPEGPARFPGRRHAIYCGRFEPYKNQLGFIEAMNGHEIPVLVVGGAHPGYPEYFQACRAKAKGNVQVIGRVPDEELAALYRSARVHVLPSWGETTGLVSLEAALCGCNVVTTSRGYARDYFGDLAWYCEYNSAKSIRAATEAAYAAAPSETLRNRILNNYTWAHTARATLRGYELVLSQGSSEPAASERAAVCV